MGTYYPSHISGRRDLIEYLSQTANYKMKARYCSGNVLWVWHTPRYKATEGRDWIGCYLMSCHKGEWGYKPMDESVHPFYYSCPKKWLDSVPATCQEWREGVKAHWERKAERRRAKRGKLKRPSNAGAKRNPYANLQG